MKMNGIISLEVNNILRLKAVKITPEGSIVTIGGENGAGKSSVLDSILFGFGGDRTLPAQPIRKGEVKGTVEIKIDGYTIFKTITEAGSYLKITNADGAEIKSPQAFLNGLVGKVSFDPLAFTHMTPKDQGSELRKLVGIDTTGLDKNRAIAFNERTVANREIRQLEGALNETPCHDGMGTIEESASDLINRISASQTITRERDRLRSDIESNESSISTTELQIKQFMDDIEGFKIEIKASKLALSQSEPAENIDTLKQELDQIEVTNQKIRENQKNADLAGTHIARKLKCEKLTADIEQIDKTKAEMLQSAEYPIHGLCFDEDETVTYNGIPFAQASSAEQIRVSVAIGLAMNPKLPVMRIYDGSLLGPKALAMISEMAEAANAQIWIERVGEGDEVSVIIEDGSVKGAAVEEDQEVAQ